MGGGGGGGGVLQHFSVSPRPLGFGFGAKGLGPGLDNSLFWFPKQQKSKQKNRRISNVPMVKRNRRRVDFIEATANYRSTFTNMPSESNLNVSTTGRGRVECVKMIKESRPKLPDIQP